MIFRVTRKAFEDAFRLTYDEWREKHGKDIEEISWIEWKRKYSLWIREKRKKSGHAGTSSVDRR